MSAEFTMPEQSLPNQDDPPTDAVMRLAEEGGAFDFWLDEGEDIYTAEDGEPLCPSPAG